MAHKLSFFAPHHPWGTGPHLCFGLEWTHQRLVRTPYKPSLYKKTMPLHVRACDGQRYLPALSSPPAGLPPHGAAPLPSSPFDLPAGPPSAGGSGDSVLKDGKGEGSNAGEGSNDGGSVMELKGSKSRGGIQLAPAPPTQPASAAELFKDSDTVHEPGKGGRAARVAGQTHEREGCRAVHRSTVGDDQKDCQGTSSFGVHSMLGRAQGP